MRVIYTSKGTSKKFGVRVIYRKIRYFVSPTRSTCAFIFSHPSLILLGLNTQIMFSEEYNVLSKQSRIADKGWSLIWVWRETNNPSLEKSQHVTNCWANSAVNSEQNSNVSGASLAPSSWFDISGTLKYTCLRAGALIVELE